MVFSSVTFLFYFLPVFLLLYFVTPFKNTVLLIFSLLFYAWGEAGYVILLLVSILFNYGFGVLIDRHRHKNRIQQWYLGAGIAINLLLIGYYKYFNFFAQNLLSVQLDDPVHLPLGISFFTFQAISYLLDVYRKEAKAEKNPFNLALYISMFPQLIAGPIVRFKTVAKQINHRLLSLDNIYCGIRIFIVGLAQKALIANTVAVAADGIFALPEAELTAAVAWLGTLCYTLQIYFDFAGYSHMAIGLGLMMGFTFPQNFNFPYIAQSITDFWRRWHMSSSSWFRDYLYIPLGGNRISAMRTYLNLMIVFVLCGLWHGAAWTFIIWGIYHGFFLILERYKLTKILAQLWSPLRHVYALCVVMIGWVIFRAESFSHLHYYLKAMFGLGEGSTAVHTTAFFLNNSLLTMIIMGVIFSMPVLAAKSTTGEAIDEQKSTAVSGLRDIFFFCILVLSLINVASGSYNPFIYFRF